MFLGIDLCQVREMRWILHLDFRFQLFNLIHLWCQFSLVIWLETFCSLQLELQLWRLFPLRSQIPSKLINLRMKKLENFSSIWESNLLDKYSDDQHSFVLQKFSWLFQLEVLSCVHAGALVHPVIKIDRLASMTLKLCTFSNLQSTNFNISLSSLENRLFG